MTFESLAIAGLSIGLTMKDILEFKIGLTLGLLNEKNNQMIDLKIKQKEKEDDTDKVIVGNAEMLMNI